MGGAHSYKSDTLPRTIQDNMLPNAKTNAKLPAQLYDLGIEYIILAKDFDYKEYDYLASEQGIQVIYNDSSIEVFRIDKESEL